MACLAALIFVAGCTGGTAGRSSPSSPPPTSPAGTDGPRPVAVNVVPPAEPTNGAVLPEEFGAAGDGFSDDTAAMQAAVDAAAERGARVVLGEDRTYLLTGSIELPSGTFVTGAGPSSVLQFTWRFNDPEHDGFYLGNREQTGEGNTDIVLQRFAIRGAAPGTPAGPKELLTEPNVPAIRFRLVDRFRISQLDIGYAPGISIIHQGCSNGAIVQNNIHHSGRDGINSTWHHRNMHDILIADNVITKVGDDAIAVVGAPGEAVNRQALPYRIVVEDNVVRGWPSNVNGLALGRGISVLAASRVRLERNVIMRTHSAGILVSASTRPFSIDPGTGAPWRSSRIQVVDNRIVDAGQNFVGTDPDVDTPKHDGIVIKESDHVWLSRNTVIRPYGEEVSLLDCRRCTDDTETKADEKVQP
jgi:hypothetical protein